MVGVEEEPKHTTAGKPGSLLIIQYSLDWNHYLIINICSLTGLSYSNGDQDHAHEMIVQK